MATATSVELVLFASRLTAKVELAFAVGTAEAKIPAMARTTKRLVRVERRSLLLTNLLN